MRSRAKLKQLVSFRELNLIGEWPMRGLFQLIVCRNVTIYFDQPTREKIWSRFARYLTDDAWLYLGHSERLSGDAADVLFHEGRRDRIQDETENQIMIRVLVVDDSASMRALVKRAALSEPGIEVVGEAANTAEAREMIKQLDPDVVTLDVEMPGMNGLEFLGKLMRLRPTPVIMVSNLTAPGAAATIEALATGAFECIAKPNGVQGNTFAALPNLLRNAAAARKNIQQRNWSAPVAPRKASVESSGGWPEVIGLGASTGGVEALLQILADFPENCPPDIDRPASAGGLHQILRGTA